MLPETTKNAEAKLKCEACGKKFGCGAQTGKCWCFEIETDEETLAELKENFQNCLCPDCLTSGGTKK
jgi:hypothetical protein